MATFDLCRKVILFILVSAAGHGLETERKLRLFILGAMNRHFNF